MKRRSTPFRISCLLSVSLAACVAPNTSGAPSDAPDGGSGGSQPANVEMVSLGNPVNPYGVSYPSQMCGYQHRRGSQPGDVLCNFALQGYADADRSKPAQTISMSDYYDPQQKNHKLLHISVAAAWCQPCQMEAVDLVPMTAAFKTKGVVFLSVLTENVLRQDANLENLSQWISQYMMNYTNAVDPGARLFGPFFDGSTYPFNLNIDTRTMEILTAEAGANDVVAEVQQWLEWVDQHPPMKL